MARQFGVISRTQARESGMSDRAIDWRVRQGRWRRIHRGVFATRAVASSWHQRLMAAVVAGGPGAIASHRSAASLWQLDGIRLAPIEISVKVDRSLTDVSIHRRQRHDDPPTVVIQGIPATGIDRTLLDLASVVPPDVAGLALDDALRRGLTTLEDLGSLPRAGKPGTRAFGRLLRARDARDELVESRLESDLLSLLRRRGLPLPVPQLVVSDEDTVVARIDFAYPSQRLAIEVDGYRWHGGAEAWARDARRDNRLKLLGWTVLRFTWADVRRQPEVVVGQIRAGLSLPSGQAR